METEINDWLTSLFSAATSAAIWGNLIVGVWCLVKGKRRTWVASLLLSYLLGSAAIGSVLFFSFFHTATPPYVDWIVKIWVLVGLGTFFYLIRLLVADDDQQSTEG